MGGGPIQDRLLIIFPFANPPESTITHLRHKFPQIDIVTYTVPYTRDASILASKLPSNVYKDATMLCTVHAFPQSLSEAPKLSFVQLLSAGSNQIQNNPIYTESEIPIATTTGIHGPQIAEWVVMTGLVFSHGYRKYYEDQKRHEWAKNSFSAEVRDRVGLQLGVLGYGSIGRQVGRVAKAMGMQVLAYTASEKDTPAKRRDPGFVVPGTGDEEGVIPDEWFSGLDKESLHRFLGQGIDWLVVAVPLTKETTHFLSTEEFRVMAEGLKGKDKEGRKPFVTNIARGPIIDQPALIKALKDGTLGGAALDVTDPEPLPSDSELWGLENVIITPHVAGSTTEYITRALQVLETNLERREKGEPMLNLVRRDRGY